jgi:putative ABC transport system substrate-binding protein
MLNEGLAKELAAAVGRGLTVPPEPFTSAHRRLIVRLAAQYRLPATYGLCDFVTDDGLMPYASDISDIYSRSATYIDRISRGGAQANSRYRHPPKLHSSSILKP